MIVDLGVIMLLLAPVIAVAQPAIDTIRG